MSWEELGEEKVMSASGKHVHVLEAEVDGKPNPERVELLNLLKGEQHSALIFNMFPKFIRFSNHGKAPVVRHFMDKIRKFGLLLKLSVFKTKNSRIFLDVTTLQSCFSIFYDQK